MASDLKTVVSEIQSFLGRADDFYFSEAGRAITKDKEKLRKALPIYLAAAERAETADSEGIFYEAIPDYFSDTAARTYKLAGDIAKGLRRYGSAASLYESSVENYDKTSRSHKSNPIMPRGMKKGLDSQELEARKGAKRMRRMANFLGVLEKLSFGTFVFFFIGTFLFFPRLIGNVIFSKGAYRSGGWILVPLIALITFILSKKFKS